MSNTEHINDPAAATFEWLQKERAYQVGKFGIELDDVHTNEGIGKESWWQDQIGMYMHRANLLTLDNILGRQALAKAVATACGMLESVIRTHGRLPAPGVSSGNVDSTPTRD